MLLLHPEQVGMNYLQFSFYNLGFNFDFLFEKYTFLCFSVSLFSFSILSTI